MCVFGEALGHGSGLGACQDAGRPRDQPGIETLPNAARRDSDCNVSSAVPNGRRQPPCEEGRPTTFYPALGRWQPAGGCYWVEDRATYSVSDLVFGEPAKEEEDPVVCRGCCAQREGTINLGCPQAHWPRGGRCDGGLLLDGASSCCMMQCCRVMHPISPQNWTTLRGPCSALPRPNLRRKVSFRRSVNSRTKYGVIEQSDKWLVGRGFS